MPTSGIVGEEPFYTKAWFWQDVIAFVFLVLFVVMFWPEVRTMSQFVGPLRERFGDTSVVESQQAETLSQAEAPTNKQSSIKTPFAKEISVWIFRDALLIIGVNVLVNLFLFVLGIFVVSQFVLPVRTVYERWTIFGRVCRYILGMHGPAISVKEGQIVAGTGELDNPFPGVAIVDLSSAIAVQMGAVNPKISSDETKTDQKRKGLIRLLMWPIRKVLLRLRSLLLRIRSSEDTSPPVRIEGSGIVFMRWGEKVSGVVSLRRQFRINPKVRLTTRDGFEIQAPVFALFTLGEKPDVLQVTYMGEEEAENLRVIKMDDENNFIEITGFNDLLDEDDKAEIHRFVQNNSRPLADEPSKPEDKRRVNAPYVFDADRVFAAIYSRAHKGADIEEWTELPQGVANETFRNMLSLERFDDLYKPDAMEEFPLVKQFKPEMGRRMRNQGVMSYKFYRHKERGKLLEKRRWNRAELDIAPVRALRSSKVLRDRGIKVIASGFPQLNPVHEGVRKQLVEYWIAKWKSDADIIEAEHKLEAMRIHSATRAETQREMIYALSQILNTQILSREALTIRLFQTLESIANEPGTREQLPDNKIGFLWDLRQFLLD